MFLSYASEKGHALIDRGLYIPEDWAKDSERREEAGIPSELEFKTKPAMALEMIKEATKAGVPYQWATADCAYGDSRDIREWLEENKKNYVMAVSGKEYFWIGNKQHSISSILKSLPAEGWTAASCGEGTKGEREYDWIRIEINPIPIEGWERHLLIRRSKSDKEDLRAFACFGPIGTPMLKYIEITGKRWTIETCFEEAKGQAGLDGYEVRIYSAWHKHITLSMAAAALLTVLSANSLGKTRFQDHSPGSSSFEAFKKGRNLAV